jgi:hypothetical protein
MTVAFKNNLSERSTTGETAGTNNFNICRNNNPTKRCASSKSRNLREMTFRFKNDFSERNAI